MNEIQVLGKIVELRDSEFGQGTALVVADRTLYEVPFHPKDRDLVCRVFQARPRLLLQVKGRVEGGCFAFAPRAVLAALEDDAQKDRRP